MNKNLIIILFITLCAISGCTSNKLNCHDEKVVLEGKLGVVQDKYPINIISTSNASYWIYGSSNDIQDNLNKNVKIEAYISYFDKENTECNICSRECDSCQCPSQDLLYDVKIIEVLQ